MRNFVLLFLLPIVALSQTEATISSGTAALHFRTFGTGSAVLIINGGPGMNSEGFSSMAQQIAALGFMAITYDQRGTGQSIVEEPSSKTITMDLMAQDIEQLRKHLKIEKWTVLGHSFGGIMATYYAAKYPQCIDKLIFSSSGGINMKFTSYLAESTQKNLNQVQRDSMAFFQAKLVAGDTSAQTRKSRAKYLANAYVYDKSKAGIIAQRLVQIDFAINTLVISDLNRIHYDCSRKFTHFKNPVLVLQGKNDIIAVDTAREIAAAFPNSKLVLIDRCAHYGWLDAPDTYFSSISEFLNS